MRFVPTLRISGGGREAPADCNSTRDEARLDQAVRFAGAGVRHRQRAVYVPAVNI